MITFWKQGCRILLRNKPNAKHFLMRTLKKTHNLKVAQTVLRTAHQEEDWTEGVTGVGVCLLAGCPAYVKY